MDNIRLMIVDDREEICRELSKAIELSTATTSRPIIVIATAFDGQEALEKADVFLPDLILMDLEMPRLGGLSTAKRIKAVHPDIVILALTIHDSPSTCLAMTQANMDGLISKGANLASIIEEIYRCWSIKDRSQNPKNKNRKDNKNATK
jgi:DNA-binding NarL/FixJ family response regulator